MRCFPCAVLRVSLAPVLGTAWAFVAWGHCWSSHWFCPSEIYLPLSAAPHSCLEASDPGMRDARGGGGNTSCTPIGASWECGGDGVPREALN